jgi:xylan 1,4-beta-xylosidase
MNCYMKKITLIFLILFSLKSYAQQITIQNPILSGFYPDPSVERVGDDYYLVTSTFSYFPGIPIFHSKDLKNWRQIGNIINRPSQMDFLGETVSRGLFAPTITFHNGLFYVLCTDIDHEGNFIVTAENPAGPWSDPIKVPQARGIDPSIFFEGEKAYIIYNSDAPNFKPLYQGHRTVRMYELDPKTLKVVGEEVQLVNGGVDLSKKPVWIEAPHIFKRGRYYYLTAAEGGTSVNHSQVIFRSEHIKGPYIPWEKNPILTHRNLDPNRPFPITSTGHADLFEGPDGNMYAVFLAVRPYEGNFYNTGRETFIAPVIWTEDGWPIIAPAGEVKYQYTFNWKEQPLKGAAPQSGSFAYRTTFQDTLDQSLLFLRTHDKSWYTLNAKNGLTINLLPTTIMELQNPAFIGKRQQHLIAGASMELNFLAKAENEQAGLTIFQNEFHFYYLAKSIKNGRNVVQLFKGNPESKSMDLLAERNIGKSKKTFLKISAQNADYSFYFAEKPDQWVLLKDKVDGKFLSTDLAGGFVGSLFGIYGTSNGKSSTNKASVKWLDYAGIQENAQK